MTTERYWLLGLGALNVACGALLAFSGLDWPNEVKAGVVVGQAVATYIITQIKSWDDAAPPPSPHG